MPVRRDQRWRRAAGALLICGVQFGCARDDTGAVPEQGYNFTPVVYEKRRQYADAVIYQVPFIDPNVPAAQPLPLPEPLVWKKGMRIAFVGEIQFIEKNQVSTRVWFEGRPILANGELGERKWYDGGILTPSPGADKFSYRIDGQAPFKTGRYRVAVKTIGSDFEFDIEKLPTFVEGDIVVQ